MKINTQRFLRYLRKSGYGMAELFCVLGDCDLDIVAACFSGASLNEEQARKLVNALGAEVAYKVIDWKGSNARKPRRKQIFIEYAY